MQGKLMLVTLAGCLAGSAVAQENPAEQLPSREVRPRSPAIPLVETFRRGIDPALYWISEKYDGVRAIWDGHELRSRSGRRIVAPLWFLERFPAQPLDGELWLGRGRFDELSAMLRTNGSAGDAGWRAVYYLVFELPGAAGSFTERSSLMRAIIEKAQVQWLRPVIQFRVADERELMRRLQEIVRDGGEGLVLHLAAAPYATGRTPAMLKLKPYSEGDAVVVGYEEGRRRLAGKAGALLLQTAEGKRFRVGSGLTDKLRSEPPALGAMVSYRYQELTKEGIPRFPRFLRVRDDF